MAILKESIFLQIMIGRQERPHWQSFVYYASSTDAPLGAAVNSLGYGSKACSHMDEVNDAVDSLTEDAEDRKGRMLSHFLYREFLKYYYEAEEMSAASASHEIHDVDDSQDEKKMPPQYDKRIHSAPAQNDDDQERSRNYSLDITDKDFKIFEALYESMEAKTEHGLVAKKNKDEKTPEPCQTSFLGSFINNMITGKLGSGDDMVVWLSEYTYFREGTGDNKNPRQDGNMALRDPANQSVWRAILSYQAKLEGFEQVSKYESRSNCIDAISRFGWSGGQPTAKVWPLLAVRHVVPSCTFTVYAMSPDSASHYKMVPMLSETGTSNFFRAIMAAGRAGQSFYKKVQEKGACPDFCICSRNVCLQRDEGTIFKSFIRPTIRKPHLELCRKYISEDARLWKLGEIGYYLELPYVGRVLSEDKKCLSVRFFEIADTVQKLHDEGLVHGDIHLENCIFGGERGALIDFDLAGKADETTYPASLYNLDESFGGRHEEVSKAIHKRSIAKLVVKKGHDWSSLGKVMQLFRPEDDADSETWHNYVQNPKALLSVASPADSCFTVVYEGL